MSDLRTNLQVVISQQEKLPKLNRMDVATSQKRNKQEDEDMNLFLILYGKLRQINGGSSARIQRGLFP